MWNVKPKVIPVIGGATGTISKSLIEYLSNITGKHKIKEIKKTSRIGHCTHSMESVNSKIKGKAVPLQAWGGPEGSRKLRFPQDGGKVVSPTHRPPLPPGNAPGTHFC